MKKYTPLLLSCAFLSSVAFGQEDFSAEETPLPSVPSPREHNSRTENASFFAGSNMATIINVGVVQNWSLGWLITDEDRIVLDLMFSNSVTENDESQLDGADDADTQARKDILDSEQNSKGFGLSYYRAIKSMSSVTILTGISATFSTAEAKVKSQIQDFNNDIDASTLTITEDSLTTTSSLTLGLHVEIEYTVLKDLAMGFNYGILRSNSKAKIENKTETRQYMDGILVGESDPDIDNQEAKTSSLENSTTGLFLRYYF